MLTWKAPYQASAPLCGREKSAVKAEKLNVVPPVGPLGFVPGSVGVVVVVSVLPPDVSVPPPVLPPFPHQPPRHLLSAVIESSVVLSSILLQFEKTIAVSATAAMALQPFRMRMFFQTVTK